jgi:murein DD-endopeptidase MepM/ murein hydrolase activator NlpD
LAHQSSKVKVDQAVATGHVIAEMGTTGYTFLPDLHFQVFIYTGTNIWIDFDTVSIRDFGQKSSI